MAKLRLCKETGSVKVKDVSSSLKSKTHEKIDFYYGPDTIFGVHSWSLQSNTPCQMGQKAQSISEFNKLYEEVLQRQILRMSDDTKERDVHWEIRD